MRPFHCVQRIHIRSFSCLHSVRMTRINPNMDTFCAVFQSCIFHVYSRYSVQEILFKNQIDSPNIFHVMGNEFPFCFGRCYYDVIKLTHVIYIAHEILLKLEFSVWLYCANLCANFRFNILKLV